ncbi:MAG: hypothetical protein QOJ32_693 [Frankiaceae bacterium]|jgi:uncharacterized protein YndB with AHSA1/START domain|nr:hypothetical protein [Frankiaceae bacterium]
MAVVTRDLPVPPEQAFAVLADGWLYGLWVVGASHIRDVEDEWPAVGTSIHHAFGAWPVMVRDRTEVLESDPPNRLVLQARAWPAGQARIEIDIEPVRGDACRIHLTEYPVTGIGAATHNPVFDALIARRNVESLARFAALAERRGAATPSDMKSPPRR